VSISVDGSIVIADPSAGRVARLTSKGNLDRHFASGGLFRISETAGSEGRSGRFFHSVSVSADRGGNLFVFGEQVDNGNVVGGEGELPTLSESNAAVFKFEPNGQPDLQFGDGKGFIRSGFGLFSPYSEATPLVSALNGKVDSRGRPVLIAGVASPTSGCAGHGGPLVQPRAIVRLTQGGSPDLSFGTKGGVSELEGSAVSPLLDLNSRNEIAADVGRSGGSQGRCQPGTTLYRFSARGQSVQPFGSHGSRNLSEQHLEYLGRSGATTIGRSSSRGVTLSRLTATGQKDKGFGDRGIAKVVSPHHLRARLKVVAGDAKGSLFVAGVAGSSRSAHESGDVLVVGRLKSSGVVDPLFGQRGWIVTKFSRRLAPTSVSGALDARGRLVVAGTMKEPDSHGEGFFAARFLVGS
jgi:uncharacterized delta-60 repeat protein